MNDNFTVLSLVHVASDESLASVVLFTQEKEVVLDAAKDFCKFAKKYIDTDALLYARKGVGGNWYVYNGEDLVEW